MFVSVIFIIFCTSAYAGDVIVDLPDYGSINGSDEEISRGGVKFYAFRGVQYGKEPKGDLRFRVNL